MLYRKYRPKSFAEVEGQKHVVKTLEGALLTNNVSHAYLFSGSRGTGKTTLARLLAKALICQKRKSGQTEPCNSCSTCLEVNENRSLNIVEIDAASNRGIEDIREIRDSAQVAASAGGYKIFIIDEVHMLTAAAFNALLKTLEEPPSHVVFVLATTESHKVPETILSRVQRFEFKNLNHDEITAKLKRIAKHEKLSIEPKVYAMLSNAAHGSVRDAESLMAKIISFAGSTITSDHVRDVLGLVPTETHDQLYSLIESKDADGAIKLVNEVFFSGIDLNNFTKQFISHTRDRLVETMARPTVVSTSHAPHQTAAIISRFIEARNQLTLAPIPQLPLELAIVDLCRK